MNERAIERLFELPESHRHTFQNRVLVALKVAILTSSTPDEVRAARKKTLDLAGSGYDFAPEESDLSMIADYAKPVTLKQAQSLLANCLLLALRASMEGKGFAALFWYGEVVGWLRAIQLSGVDPEFSTKGMFKHGEATGEEDVEAVGEEERAGGID